MPTIKGEWLFNNTPTVETSLLQIVNFTTISSAVLTECTEIIVIKSPASSETTIYYHSTTHTSDIEVYNSTSGWKTANLGESIKKITFTEEQTVSTEFYEWFTANAKPIQVTIFFGEDRTAIADLVAGQNARLQCKDMAVDLIEMMFFGAGSIHYNGTRTAVKAGYNAAMTVGNSVKKKVMLDDVVVMVEQGEDTYTVKKNDTGNTVSVKKHITEANDFGTTVIVETV